MQLVLSEVIILLGVLAAVTKFLDLWLRPLTKDRLRKRVANLSSSLKQSDPLIVIKSPFEAASVLLDRIFGHRLFSWKAFRRSTLLSVALIVFALTVSGLRLGVPFGIYEPPWTTLDRTFDVIEQAAKDQAKRKTDKPEEDELVRRGYQKALEFRTLRVQAIYSVTFFVLITTSAVIANFLCLGMSRKTLRDMAQAATLFTLFSLSFINFLFSFALYTACISLICTASLPFLWVIPPLLVLCATHVSWLLAVSLTLPLIVAAMKLSPQWMEIVSVVATLPGILVILASLLALMAFPFRHLIRRLIVGWLVRAAESDKGVLAFSAAAFTLLGMIVALIPRLLFGSLGLS